MPVRQHRALSTGLFLLALLLLFSSPGPAHAESDVEGDPNAIGHSANGYYLDVMPLGKIELPRLLLTRHADGLSFDVYSTTKEALQSGRYVITDGEGNVLSEAETQYAIDQKKHYNFPLAAASGPGIVIDFSITRHLLAVFLSALLLIIIGLRLGARYRRGIGREEAPRGVWQNMMEVLILFVRDEVAKPAIGGKYSRYMPYLLSVFFFILIGNLLGLIPWGVTATSNIMVTGTLAAFTFVITQFSGTKDYWRHIFNPPGVPLAVKPFLVPAEFIGLFTKPLALAFRLFGNMVSGHLVIVSILGLIFIFAAQFGAGVGWASTLLSVPVTLFVWMLKFAISFIQAYVFTILSALFIGMALEDHEHEHHEEEPPEPHEALLEQAEAYVPGDGVSTTERPTPQPTV